MPAKRESGKVSSQPAGFRVESETGGEAGRPEIKGWRAPTGQGLAEFGLRSGFLISGWLGTTAWPGIVKGGIENGRVRSHAARRVTRSKRPEIRSPRIAQGKALKFRRSRGKWTADS